MKTALEYAEHYLRNKRGVGAAGQTIENMRPVTLPEVIRQAQIEALQFALESLDDNPLGGAVKARIAELEAEAVRPSKEVG